MPKKNIYIINKYTNIFTQFLPFTLRYDFDKVFIPNIKLSAKLSVFQSTRLSEAYPSH